jgi:hypothetical protein
MDRLSDLDINCRVRRVLVRHWIDLGRISVKTTSGVVRLSGALVRLPSAGSPLSPASVAGIVTEVRRIQDVRRIQASFENWVESIGTWVCVAKPIGASKLTNDACVSLDSSDSQPLTVPPQSAQSA